MSENEKMTRAAGLVGAAALASRLLGFVRDMAIAGGFGAGLGADAFFVAFRVPNLMRRLMAEGSLTLTFIPAFTRLLHHSGREAAFGMATAAFRAVSLAMAAVVPACIVAAPVWTFLLAPGFRDDPQKFALTVTLMRWMFPYLLTVSLVALCMGVLNALGHFLAPALAPFCLNVTLLAAIFFICPRLETPVLGLGIGVLAGGILQLLIQVPPLFRKGFRLRLAGPLVQAEVGGMGRGLAPSVVGAAAYQINVVVGTLLASFLPDGGVSYLYYGDRLVQFPLGVFATGISTVVLPDLSRHAANNDIYRMNETLAYALRLIFFITIPATVGLIVLREPIVAHLFERGAFDEHATRMTARVLLCYGLGLWAFAGVRIVVAAFYAMGDTRTPLRIALASMAANLVLSLLGMHFLESAGIALGAGVASMLNFALLVGAMRRKIRGLDLGNLLKSACKNVFCSLLMGVAVWNIASWRGFGMDRPVADTLGGLAFVIVCGVSAYAAFSFFAGTSELRMVFNIIGKEPTR